MKTEIKCGNCLTDNIVIENKLFFSEKESAVDIACYNCKAIIKTEYTDGWFFIQTKEQFDFDEKIEEQKLKFIYKIE